MIGEPKTFSEFTEEERLHFIFLAKAGHQIEFCSYEGWVPSVFPTEHILDCMDRNHNMRYRIKP